MSRGDTKISFEVCQPVEEHANQVMMWRNDPATLSVFFHREPKIWESFWPEYRDTYFAHGARLHPLFALANGERVGFLRFNPVSHPRGLPAVTVDISINLSPSVRGQGLGAKVLKAGLEYLRGKGVDSVYAEVRVHNHASIGAFKAAGFVFIGEKEKWIPDTGESHAISCFVADLFSKDALPVSPAQGLSAHDRAD